MELLGRIVPAIRETRTPLITGYAWVAAVWLSIAAYTDYIPRAAKQPDDTAFAALRDGLEVLSGFGLGVALTVIAFVTGSATGFIWDRFLPPLDPRPLRDRAGQLFSEAQLRLQLVPPVVAATAALGSDHPPALIASPMVIVLALHGSALWQEASSLPLRPDLSGLDLSAAYLRGAKLNHCDLTNSNLQSADLTGASLNGANLLNAQLDNAILDHISLHRVSGGLTARQIRDSASANGVDLSQTSVSGDLSDAQLEGANLFGADLSGVNLAGANLRSVNLANAKLRNVGLNVADLAGADLSSSYLGGAELADADLRCAQLTDADLQSAHLVGAELGGSDLTRASLVGVHATGVLLAGAVLRDADLRRANLRSADLSGADLRGADLTDADLTDADLTDADLTDALGIQ